MTLSLSGGDSGSCRCLFFRIIFLSLLLGCNAGLPTLFTPCERTPTIYYNLTSLQKPATTRDSQSNNYTISLGKAIPCGGWQAYDDSTTIICQEAPSSPRPLFFSLARYNDTPNICESRINLLQIVYLDGMPCRATGGPRVTFIDAVCNTIAVDPVWGMVSEVETCTYLVSVQTKAACIISSSSNSTTSSSTVSLTTSSSSSSSSSSSLSSSSSDMGDNSTNNTSYSVTSSSSTSSSSSSSSSSTYSSSSSRPSETTTSSYSTTASTSFRYPNYYCLPSQLPKCIKLIPSSYLQLASTNTGNLRSAGYLPSYYDMHADIPFSSSMMAPLILLLFGFIFAVILFFVRRRSRLLASLVLQAPRNQHNNSNNNNNNTQVQNEIPMVPMQQIITIPSSSFSPSLSSPSSSSDTNGDNNNHNITSDDGQRVKIYLADECVICMTNEVQTVFVPCCHAAACRVCGEVWIRSSSSCPVCRKPISKCLWKESLKDETQAQQQQQNHSTSPPPITDNNNNITNEDVNDVSVPL
eukprot:TRINITY_DN2371_c2_g1_i13.p1 TRINITY_DN2371_c2_g1~~TRINITY_DN2371_c2_g1_i13.p1  ORF type:complete len:524 (+),score=135.08 TRINITY_DN2371_c2_g1_i13:221-1792(+)